MSGLRAAEIWALPGARTNSHVLAVISDDETLAERVSALLEREGMHVRLEATGTGVETLDALERRASLVIIRHAHDRRSLDRLVRQVERRLRGAIIVVVVAAGDRPDVGVTLTSGADALVREEDLDSVLGPVVRAAAGGQASAPAGLLHLMQPPALSYRERQILGLALAGMTNAQIAERLYLAPSTVKTHISAAFRRLGVHSRREATALLFAADEPLRRTMLATLRLSEELPPPDDEQEED